MAYILDAITSPHDNDSRWAWDNYKRIVLEASRGKRVLEIGAGRHPLFSEAETLAHRIEYIANDISASELDLADWKCEKACFDICADLPPHLIGAFDFAFSQMVLEHVTDGRKYYENVRKLLRENGLCLTFHPTLFSPPFAINRIVPPALSAWLLRLLRPGRQSPKFPATYQYCFSTKRNTNRILEIGFQDVEVIPFYGHRYFSRIPVVRELDGILSGFCTKRDIALFSSFAYTIVRS